MKTAIVVLRDQGLRTACRIIEKWPEEEPTLLYLHRRLEGQKRIHETEEPAPCCDPYYFSELKEVLPELWEGSSLLIFIMATGIVVRHIAPYLQGKDRDPAVLVLDEKGEFVISLLSGHLGGANAWAKSVAQWIHAQPVITTATDVQGLTAPDEYARRFGWSVEPLSGLKEVNSLLLEQGYLKVWTDCLPEEHPCVRTLITISLRIKIKNMPSYGLQQNNLRLSMSGSREKAGPFIWCQGSLVSE